MSTTRPINHSPPIYDPKQFNNNNKLSADVLSSDFDPIKFSESIYRNMATVPFRFLDLPCELRCMVYEKIVIETKCHTLEQQESGCSGDVWPLVPNVTNSPVKLIRKSLPVALLRTCRLINNEATAFFKSPMEELAKEPLRFVLDYSAAIALTIPRSPLVACFPDRPNTWTYHAPANPATKTFTARCRPFLEHVRQDFRAAQDRSGYHAEVEMTILEPITRSEHEDLAYTSLRVASTKFALGFLVMYQEAFRAPSPRGSWPPTPTFRPVGLHLGAWELNRRKLRRMLGE
jgi:hypothetical protein